MEGSLGPMEGGLGPMEGRLGPVEGSLGPEGAAAVASLAALLRRCGSKVLTDASCLSLTWPVYQKVTAALASFAEATSSSSKDSCWPQLGREVVLDLEYLKSFLARVPSMRLQHSSASEWSSGAGPASLASLNSLSALHLKRLPLQVVEDLASLQPSLRRLTLEHCSLTLDWLLSSCLSSLPPSLPSPPWSSLSSLTVQHCSLTSLGPALQHAPALTSLDCSHNRLTCSAGLEALAQLSCLLLAYNLLASLPSLHPEAPLTVLAMAYNRLEQVAGLEAMPCLLHLDVSGNCLMHHDALAPISSLPGLRQLDLRQNPLSTHPQHRTLASSWLHPSLSCLPLPPVLDTAPLSRQEAAMVGSSRLLVPDSPSSCPGLEEEEHRSVSLPRSREGSVVSGVTSTVGRRRRRRRVREAVIEDQQDYSTDGTNTEAERERGGLQEVPVPAPGPFLPVPVSYSEGGSDERLEALLGITDTLVEERREEPAGPPALREVEEQDQQVVEEEQGVTEQLQEREVVESQTRVSMVSTASTDSAGIYCQREDREASPQVAADSGLTRLAVTREVPGALPGQEEQLSLALCREFLREQGPGGGTTVKWFLHSLQSVELLPGGGEGRVRVHLSFSTVRRDRRERVYGMEGHSYSLLMSLVGQVLLAAASTLAARPALQCVRCQALFSHRSGPCPVCGSSMVLEQEQSEGEVADVGIPVCEDLDLGLLASPRASTPTNSPSTNFQTQTLSPVKHTGHQALVTADIHPPSSRPRELPDLLPHPEPGRGRNPGQEREEEGREDGKEKSCSPGLEDSEDSSDISVLSNPSECSIEVLEPATPTPALHTSSAVTPPVAEVQGGGCRGLEGSCSSGLTSSGNSQEQAGVVRGEDTSSMEEGDITFHSCRSDSEAEEGEVTLGSMGETSLLGDTTVEEGRESRESREGTVEMEAREVTGHEDRSPGPEEEEAEPPPVMSWDFGDYSLVDHRLQLWCDLELFREGENLLLVARGQLWLRSSPNTLWPGVLVVTNKKLHLLRVTAPETDSPSSWLEVRRSATISRLERLVGLVGGQGLGLELGPEKSAAVAPPSFYRLPLGSTGYSGGEGGDCYYLLLRDRERTSRLTDQLVDCLQQEVRAQPIPVTWLTQEEENLLATQVSRGSPDAESSVKLFQLARIRLQGQWESVSVIVTPSHLVLTGDFFCWLFQPEQKELEFITALPIHSIQSLSIYERWPNRLSLRTEEGESRTLALQTEAGVLQLVAALRGPWEAATGATLEEVTKFHMSGSLQVVVMQELLTDDSVTPSTFSLGQWIKVTSQTRDSTSPYSKLK